MTNNVHMLKLSIFSNRLYKFYCTICSDEVILKKEEYLKLPNKNLCLNCYYYDEHIKLHTCDKQLGCGQFTNEPTITIRDVRYCRSCYNAKTISTSVKDLFRI